MAETLRQIVDGELYLVTMQQRKGKEERKEQRPGRKSDTGQTCLLEEPEEVLEVESGYCHLFLFPFLMWLLENLKLTFVNLLFCTELCSTYVKVENMSPQIGRTNMCLKIRL